MLIKLTATACFLVKLVVLQNEKGRFLLKLVANHIGLNYCSIIFNEQKPYKNQ